MTELVILRCIVFASFVWFLISEYLHWKALKKAYRSGFAKALNITFEEVHQEVMGFLKDYADDLKVVVGAMEREQNDAKSTGKTRNREK